MCGDGHGWGGWRAITAVIALYALVLQAFLGGLMPVGPAIAGDVLCLHDASTAGDGTPAPAHHDHRACCIAAHLPAATEPPALASALIAWPPCRAVRVAWRDETIAAARAPPGAIAPPRGPPSA